MTVSKLTKKAVKSLLRDKSTTLLGEGAYGTVYSAIFEGRQCVVKIGLSASSIPDFVQESRLMELLGGAGGAPIPLALCRTLPALVMTHCGSKKSFRLSQCFGREPLAALDRDPRPARDGAPSAASHEGHCPL